MWLYGRTNSSDGDLVDAGNHGDVDAWLVKVDSSGKILSNKCFGGEGQENVNYEKMCVASDGSVWLGTTSYSTDENLTPGHHGDNNNSDVCLFHVKDDGVTLLSAQSFGGTSTEVLWGIEEASDGSVWFVSTTESTDGDLTDVVIRGSGDAWLVKVSSDGKTILSSKRFGGSEWDEVYGFAVAKDGSLWLCGVANSTDGDLDGLVNQGGADGWVFHVAPDGIDLLSSKIFGGTEYDEFNAIVPMSDGSVWISADSESVDGDIPAGGNHGESDVWVLHMLADGTLNYNKCYGGSMTDYGLSCCYSLGTLWLGTYTNSNDYDVVLSGTANHGGYDWWITNIDTAGL